MNRFERWLRSKSSLRGLASIIFTVDLEPKELKEMISDELPKGTPKAKVLEFVQALQPFECKDYDGTKQVVARWLEETGDLVHSWDIVVTFIFDGEDRLLSYFQFVTEFVDYEFRAVK